MLAKLLYSPSPPPPKKKILDVDWLPGQTERLISGREWHLAENRDAVLLTKQLFTADLVYSICMHYACLSERAYALHSLHPSVPIKQLFSPRNKRTSSPVEAWRQHSQTSCPFEQLQNHETITSHVFDLLTNTCSQCAREFADVPMSTIMAFRIRKQPENLSPLFQQR